MKLLKFLDDIGASYLFVLGLGMSFVFYILYRGMEMIHPNP